MSFEDDFDLIPALHQLGVRVIQPTYNRRNLLGDGVMELADAGLRRIPDSDGYLARGPVCGRQPTSNP